MISDLAFANYEQECIFYFTSIHIVICFSHYKISNHRCALLTAGSQALNFSLENQLDCWQEVVDSREELLPFFLAPR